MFGAFRLESLALPRLCPDHFCEGLRNIEDCLRRKAHQLYHLGFTGSIARSAIVGNRRGNPNQLTIH